MREPKYSLVTRELTADNVDGSIKKTWIEGPGLRNHTERLDRIARDSHYGSPRQLTEIACELQRTIDHSEFPDPDKLLARVLPWLESAYSAGQADQRQAVRTVLGIDGSGSLDGGVRLG